MVDQPSVIRSDAESLIDRDHVDTNCRGTFQPGAPSHLQVRQMQLAAINRFSGVTDGRAEALFPTGGGSSEWSLEPGCFPQVRFHELPRARWPTLRPSPQLAQRSSTKSLFDTVEKGLRQPITPSDGSRISNFEEPGNISSMLNSNSMLSDRDPSNAFGQVRPPRRAPGHRRQLSKVQENIARFNALAQVYEPALLNAPSREESELCGNDLKAPNPVVRTTSALSKPKRRPPHPPPSSQALHLRRPRQARALRPILQRLTGDGGSVYARGATPDVSANDLYMQEVRPVVRETSALPKPKRRPPHPPSSSKALQLRRPRQARALQPLPKRLTGDGGVTPESQKFPCTSLQSSRLPKRMTGDLDGVSPSGASQAKNGFHGDYRTGERIVGTIPSHSIVVDEHSTHTPGAHLDSAPGNSTLLKLPRSKIGNNSPLSNLHDFQPGARPDVLDHRSPAESDSTAETERPRLLPGARVRISEDLPMANPQDVQPGVEGPEHKSPTGNTNSVQASPASPLWPGDLASVDFASSLASDGRNFVAIDIHYDHLNMPKRIYSNSKSAHSVRSITSMDIELSATSAMSQASYASASLEEPGLRVAQQPTLLPVP